MSWTKENINFLENFLETSHNSWNEILLKLPNLEKVKKKLLDHIQKFDNQLGIFPKIENVFKIFKYNLNDIKIVIIGQDCYHGKVNEELCQATGLAFSVPSEAKIPPSLRNIYKELLRTGKIKKIPKTGDISHWSDQGILLLNCSLTVSENLPGSHIKEWKYWTDSLIQELSIYKPGLIYMLWGGFAKSKKKIILKNDKNAKIIESGHPSPLNTRNPFVGSGCFDTIEGINW